MELILHPQITQGSPKMNLPSKPLQKLQRLLVLILLEVPLHSEQPSILNYLHRYYMQLKQQLADYWGVKSVLLYSAGWLAGFGVIKALVKEHDYVIMDQLSHNCLQEGASAATKNIIKFPHLNHTAMVELLEKTREKDPENGILLVT